MKKRYLKTVEEVIALKDTNTKIYAEDSSFGFYYKFVNGYFCRFDDNGDVRLNDTILLTEDGNYEKYYILEEESMLEASEEDVGKLCWFWEGSDVKARIGILSSIEKDVNGKYFYTEIENLYLHCRPLTKEEIKGFMEKTE